jgi:hypothetical protein
MRPKIALAILVVASFLLGAGVGLAGADEASQSVTSHGLTVYFGVMPAAIAEGVARRHSEANMHGTPPSAPHAQHFVVAIFNSVTGERVTDAVVNAQISLPGHELPEKTLEPMKIAGTVTYGNFFDLSQPGVYRIRLNISGTNVAAAVKKPIVIDLLYDHPIPGHRP